MVLAPLMSAVNYVHVCREQWLYLYDRASEEAGAGDRLLGPGCCSVTLPILKHGAFVWMFSPLTLSWVRSRPVRPYFLSFSPSTLKLLNGSSTAPQGDVREPSVGVEDTAESGGSHLQMRGH